MRAILSLLILLLTHNCAFCAGKAKARYHQASWMEEIDQIQKRVLATSHWADTIDPRQAIDVLLHASSLRDQLNGFEKKLRGQKIAWALARRNIDKDLSSDSSFIEHSNFPDGNLSQFEQKMRCYVGDQIALRALKSKPGTPVLCIGEIIDFQFLKGLVVSLSVKASDARIGILEIEKWLGRQGVRRGLKPAAQAH